MTDTSSRIGTRWTGASDARMPPARTCSAADEGKPGPRHPCRIPELEVSTYSAEAETTTSTHIYACVCTIDVTADASFRAPTWGVCAKHLLRQTPWSTATESLSVADSSSWIAITQPGASDARKPPAWTCGAADEGRPRPRHPCRIHDHEVSIDSAEAELTRCTQA